MKDTDELRNQFKKVFGSEPGIYFAPGSVNIIGEHTDFNGGYVLPCAINFGTYLAIAPNTVKRMRFQTNISDYKADLSLDKLNKKIDNEWINYPLSIIDQFSKKGVAINEGVDMLFDGDIPTHVGLSSSASIELVISVALNDIYQTNFDRLTLINMSHKAENDFVGTQSSIMDAFSVGISEENTVLYLNCRTLEYDLIPFDLKKNAIVIMNSNKRSGLTASKLRERMSETGQALEALRTLKPFTDLCEITLEEFELIGDVITDPVLYRRARHIISENNRVKLAASALRVQDFNTLGQLMNDSHESLRHDYQITGGELDTLVNASRKIRGVLGARMTGTGLGGCALVLVEKRYVEALINKVGTAYENEFGVKATFYVIAISNCAGIISGVHQQLP